jgi:uncharacterized protein (DUF427 family)
VPAPAFDIDIAPERLEPTPRWVRVRVGDEWLADSRDALLLVWYGPGRLPTYCLPPSSVRIDLLTPSPPGTSAPAGFLVPHDVHAGSTVAGRAFLLRNPPAPFEAADGHWTFAWDDPGLEWYEEATRVHVHARDPRHRVDAVPSERHVRVELDGELHRDLAWSYPDPIPENPRIAGLVAFFNERVDLVVDGERLRRPFTPWSLDVRA